MAYIGLGSNLGDCRQNVLRAIICLQPLTDSPVMRSSLWQSAPVDCPPDSPPFINAAVGLVPRPEETADGLLEKLLALEVRFGPRPREVFNEPRMLDLDLISFRQATLNTVRLVLPHPRAHLRRFVLQPLSEIAPDLILPGQSLTVRQLLDNLASSEAGLTPA
jgi:2-amino-4-hydroxy-6-hydroxymethyldihydropteridine diphosphokinase